MFDNPNEELKKLEEQLLAVEEPKNDNFEAFYSDILKEFGPDQTPVKKQSSSYRKAPQTSAPKAKKGSGKKGKKGKDKDIKGLVITLCVECAGIVAVLLWWVLRFL